MNAGHSAVAPAPMHAGEAAECCKIGDTGRGGRGRAKSERERQRVAGAAGKLGSRADKRHMVWHRRSAMQQGRVRWGRERQASASWHLLPRQQLPGGPPRPTAVQRGAARATWAGATGPGLQCRHLKASGARLPPRLLGVQWRYCWVWVGGRKNMTCPREHEGGQVGAGW